MPRSKVSSSTGRRASWIAWSPVAAIGPERVSTVSIAGSAWSLAETAARASGMLTPSTYSTWKAPPEVPRAPPQRCSWPTLPCSWMTQSTFLRPRAASSVPAAWPAVLSSWPMWVSAPKRAENS